jgi:hypothetical protein
MWWDVAFGRHDNADVHDNLLVGGRDLGGPPISKVSCRVVRIVDIGTISIRGKLDNLGVGRDAFLAIVEDADVQERSSITASTIADKNLWRSE